MAENKCADSVNQLYNNYFQFKIGRGTRVLELMIQKVNLPGITVPEQKQPTIFGTTIPIPTLGIDFDPLSIEFMVDGNLVNWLSLYSWIRNLTNIEDADNNNIMYQNWHHSATLIIPSPLIKTSNVLTEPSTISQSNPLTVNFYNIVPTKLSGLIFQSDGSDAIALKASCTFRYSFYNIGSSHDPPSDASNSGLPYV